MVIKKNSKHLEHFGASILLALSLIFGTSVSQAQESCRYAFTKAGDESYGSIKKSFQHNTSYTVEVEAQSPVKDQCVLATCHLQGWASTLESDQLKRSGKLIEISTDHQALVHWLREAARAIESEKEINPIKIGLEADSQYSRSLSADIGIVPTSAWQPKIPLENGWLTRMERYVLNIVLRSRVALQATADPIKRKEIRSQAVGSLLKTFKDQVGAFPEKFEFEGATYTPHSFQEKFFPEVSVKFMGVGANPNRKMKTALYKYEAEEWVQAKLDDMERIIKNRLDSGHSVYLMYDHYREFVDTASGIMSIAAFKMPTEGRPLPRSVRSLIEVKDMGHVVVVTGYDLDQKTGKISKFKIKNSWGVKAGDNGYYHMYRDYFRVFVKAVAVPPADAMAILSTEDVLPAASQPEVTSEK